MRAFAMSLTRNSAAADDLVQDAVVKAWSNFDKFKTGTNLRAWLFTILRNTYYSLYRKRKREVEDPDGIMAGKLSEKPAHDGHLAMADFRAAFAKLSDEQREVLVLVGAEGFSYEDAAEMCGCAVGTIKSRTNRARKRLAELMELDDEEDFEITDAATLAVVTGKPAA
ncbi:ECF RNA polymerase sigma factor SigR [Marinovum algicola]|jgi:RNA polymerase sigma-70 factor (ECF subfamily)|uniref:RNA polymerase sigma factor n=2 Tax=Roseobacteraceae TaxID=2854170 RepID=A0A975ZNR7_9RHOB|nr:RNA polymerase sigma factor, sigma-70 family [Marinovum algicola DG 898]SEJ63466.1 RNA polymerase sigma-70 factor, ECF subfamily [Marinovum algicola]SLN52659.1 ECF RNA polymerase sigma factor SigR [Marinovum algicola]